MRNVARLMYRVHAACADGLTIVGLEHPWCQTRGCGCGDLFAAGDHCCPAVGTTPAFLLRVRHALLRYDRPCRRSNVLYKVDRLYVLFSLRRVLLRQHWL
jgi:hypothetical protein